MLSLNNLNVNLKQNEQNKNNFLFNFDSKKGIY